MNMYNSLITTFLLLLLLFGHALNQLAEQSMSVGVRLEELKVKLQQRRDNLINAISQTSSVYANNSEISTVNSLRSNFTLVIQNKQNLDLQLNGTNDKLDLLTVQQSAYLSDDTTNIQIAALTQLSNYISAMQRQYYTEHDIARSYIIDLKQQIARLQSQARWPNDVNDIYVPGMGTVSVSCSNQLAGPGWTVIQRRLDGNVDFYRNWSEYTKGFGNTHGEFFIGLELLHQLTSSEAQELYIQLKDFGNETRFAHYDHFVVGSSQEYYKLKSLGNYTGNAGNLLTYNLHQNFSTYDNDNDFDEDNCARDFQGAWWYAACGASNLNGPYRAENLANVDTDKGILWANPDWHDWSYSLQTVTMMIRPKLSIDN